MKNKLFLVFLSAIAVVTVVVISNREDGVKTFPSYKTSSMSGFHLTHKESDEVKWEVIAEKASFPKGNKEIILEELIMRIYDETEMVVRGGNGIYDIEKRNLTMTRPVEVDIEGAVLTTDSLNWNGEKGIISTGDSIKFKGDKFLIEGIGLSANIADRKIRVFNNVKGTFYR
ncbi:MAG TPA: LPS export ABC transporter periplasmic protein LptC [Nitrospirae bacterium]|nr:LPS export ABC transporter periplasmic protein LptC [Nitrospirota bacterium]